MRSVKLRGIEAHALATQRPGSIEVLPEHPADYPCVYGVPLKPRNADVTVDPTGRRLKSKRHDAAATELLAVIAGRYPMVCGPQVLLAMYLPPEKTAGGVYRPEVVRKEDKFQGKVGLVLALGPTAYVDDPFRTFHYTWVLPGDWVVYPAYENSHGRFEFDGITMATVPDETIKLISPAPEAVR